MQHGALYSIAFAAAVCLVCAVVVSSSAVSLKERQEANAFLDMKRNVLLAAGLAEDDESLTAEEIEERFAPIEVVVVDLRTGEELPDVDPETFDQLAEVTGPGTSRPAPANAAQVERIPNRALVYRIQPGGELETLILPIQGKGLWSTLYGFIALDSDLTTVEGITFYEHGETPGLGGEVDNPRWKAGWKGRQAFDENLVPKIHVARGLAGPPEEDPFRVDGLSGATITSRGVTNAVQFWLGEHGYGKYLEKLRERRRT